MAAEPHIKESSGVLVIHCKSLTASSFWSQGSLHKMTSYAFPASKGFPVFRDIKHVSFIQ